MKEFETEELILRKFKVEDADEIYESWIKGKLLKDIIGFEPIGGLNEVKRIVKSNIKETEWGEPRWVIQEKKTKKLIGYIATREISRKNKVCRIIFNITDCNPKSVEYLKESLQKICNYLLNEDGFDMVYTKICNPKSEKSKFKINVLEEIGMKLEGKLREMTNSKNGELLVFTLMRADLNHSIS